MISVIIPAYNSEKYIDNCLKSVLTGQQAEYEVIVVNDGSTDSTGEICHKWKALSDNLIYIEQNNQGQGSARNTAIKHSRGEWLVFLDSDDELMPGALDVLQEMTVLEVDLVWYEFWLKRRNALFEERIWISLEERTTKNLMCEMSTFLWDKMIRKECWLKNGIQLNNTYGEDVLAIYELLSTGCSVELLRQPLVIHYEREDNLSSDANKIVQFTETLNQLIKRFIDRDSFHKYVDELFYIVFRQYRLYETELQTTVLSEEQLEQLLSKCKELLENYFSEQWQLAKELMGKKLVLIGTVVPYVCDLNLFDEIICHNNLEQYLLDNATVYDKTCIFMFNIENEGKCSLHGTRSIEWELARFENCCREFLLKAKKEQIEIESVILLQNTGCNVEWKNELCDCMIEQLDVVKIIENKPFVKLWREINGCYMKPDAPIEVNTIYWNRGEYFRQEYNVNVMNSWLLLKNRNRHLGMYLEKHGYKTVAVYGAGFLGVRLIEELINYKVALSYVIDQSGKAPVPGVEVYTIEQKLPVVDLVIISVVHLYPFIENKVKQFIAADVVSLEDILLELLG